MSLDEKELEKLAELIGDNLRAKEHVCNFTKDEREAVRRLLGVSKNSVKVIIYIAGILLLYALKDLWTWFAGWAGLK
jgi:hypothetical protein